MPKPGPKPKPTALKKLKGGKKTYHRPMPKDEPQPKQATGIPRAPARLNKIGQREWRRVAKELYAVRILTNLDLLQLEMLCESFQTWVHAGIQIQEKGMLFMNGTTPQQSPWMQVANKAFDKMFKIQAQFGMSPSARVGLKVEKKKEADPLKDFQDKGKKLQAVK